MVNRLRRLKSLAFYVPVARLVVVLLFLLLGGGLGKAQTAITLVQHVSRDAGATTTSTLAFVSPNTAGDWLAVCVRGGSSSSQVFTITDSNGNTYKKAAQVGFTASAVTLAIYYAENVKGGANSVTVSDTVSGPLRFAILEYSGVATSNSLDGAAVATGVSTTANSGNLTTTANGDLLLGAIATTNAATFTPASGYTIRDLVPAAPSTKVITQDQIQTSAGLASAGSTLAASDSWGAVLVAVKAPSGVAGTPSSITATAGTPQSAIINTAFVSQLQATVKDSFNNPVGGVTVTFAAPTSGASGTFAGGANTAITNAQGIATSVVFTANSIAGGPYNVTASVAGVATPASFSLTNLAGAPATIAATSGTPQSATINTAFSTQLQATVKDSGNNPVGGVTVTFAAPSSGASGTFAGGATTAITNGQGIATSAVFTANSTAGGPYNVTASVTGVSTPATFSLTNLAGAPASITATAGTPQSVAINTAFATQLQATVKDSGNNPVTGVTVTFTAPASGASGTFAGSVNTAITNTQGVATAAIFTANSTAGGPYNVTASVTGVATPTNFSLTNLGNPPASIVATAGTPQSATINTAFSNQLQVTVKDSGNNPVNGAAVTFTAPASGASGTFAAGVNTATTNAQGIATSAVFTASSTAGGPYNVTASVAGAATPASFSLTNLVGAPAAITTTAGTPQSATINTSFATQLQATVTDAGNNPVNGVTVTFAAPASGASGTFAGGANTAITNAQGVATAAIFTANSTAGGPYNVTASVTGVATPANFSLTNLAGAPATIAATAGTPQSATVNTAFTSQLQATVKDSFNNPVGGVTVTFAAPTSGASGTFAGGTNTAITNAQGIATSAVFTANNTAGGPYNVTASVTGVSTPATFSLTNLASVAASIALVQHAGLDAGTTITASLAFTSSNTAGNWIAVGIRAGLSSAQVFTVKDSNGNTYKPAAQLGFTASAVTMAIYYAESIKGGANTVTVTGTVSGPLRIAVLEYSGVAPTNSLDATAMAQGNTASPNSGNLTTTAAGDLLLGAIATTNPGTFTAASGYTIEDRVPAVPNTKLITEDQIQTAAGLASAGATLTASDNWGVVLGAFKAAGGGGGGTSTITATAGTPQSATISTAFATQLQVTVKDSLNNPLSGVLVTFTVNPAGNGAGGAFTGSNTATTNSSGVAAANILTANSTAGSYTVTASATGATSANFSLTNTPGPAAKVSATSGSGQSAAISTAFASPLAATVTDTGNNPVSGVLVTFTPPPSGASGTFAGGSNTASTNSSGVATSATFTANSTTGGPYNVVASATGATSANFSLTNIAGAPPTISTLSLTQGPVGAKITITGSNFGPPQQTSTVTFNNTVAAFSNWTTATIDVTVPSGATTGNVVVTVGGVASNGVPFTVTPPPSIASINPTFGPIGATVTISGTNFGPTVGPISSFVTFNATQGRSSNWSDTSITIPVPQGATTGNVVVSVGGVPSNGVPFTVTPAPNITGLNPTSGPVGTSVTISGSSFGQTQPSTSALTFNGTVAAPTTWSDTSIVAPVPAGATPGNVVVNLSGVPSNGINFTVTSASGNISLVQRAGLDAGTTTSASLAFTSSNSAGNWIAVCIRGGNSSAQVFTVGDSNGNTYRQAFQIGLNQVADTLAIYYAENIKGGANTVTVSDTTSGALRFAILEYTGVAASNSLDAVPVTAQGNSTSPATGIMTTGASGDLLLSAVMTVNPASFTVGSGYTIENFVPAEPNTKLIVEDQLQRTAGNASAGASLAAADHWGMGLAAFRSASGAGLPFIVSISPATASVPTGYGTQAFTATIQNDFQNQGVTWTLSGTGCSGSTCGTLSNITTRSVTYAAPATVPNPASVTLTATSISNTAKTATATITVTQGVINVSVSPKRAAVTMSASQTVQFAATVTNDPSNSGVTWAVDSNTGGNTTTGTVSTTGLYTAGTQPGVHTVTATSVANASIAASSSVAVTDLPGVYTHHNDVQRTGQNLKEYALTPANVNSSTFGPLFSCPVDGFVFAAPLYVANLTVGAQTRNVLFIATSHDSVYAFDADSPSCVQLWMISFLSPGVTVVSTADVNDGSNDMFPEIGITSTPVIDPATNTMYLEAKTRDTVTTSSGCSISSPCYFHRLHAMDLATGTEKFGGPVLITAPNFDTRIHFQRPALLLNNGTLYLGFGSHGDRNLYQGWLMGYDATTLAQKFVVPMTHLGGFRGGVWGAGAGPAADASGNVYISTGNGNYNGQQDFGDTAVKFSPAGAILDWFTPFNQSVFNANDIDLGSSGVIILPDSVGSAAHPHLALVTGKVAILYLLDVGPIIPPSTTTMGQFNSSTNNDVQEVIPAPPPNTTLLDGGNFGSPAYWNGNIYTTGVNFPLSQFQISNGTISTPQFAKSNNNFPLRGATPVVSASGTTNGIVWILDLGAWGTNGPAILDAYDAANVSTLLYSSPTTGSGAAAPAVKFTIPVVANGRVYVGGQYKVTIFGLLPN
jgi:hypothetical protein